MASDMALVRATAAKAALDEAFWPETLLMLSRLVGSEMAVVEHFRKDSGAVKIGFTDRPDIVAETRDAHERHSSSHLLRELTHTEPLDTLFHGDLIGNDDALGQSEHYVEFLRHSGLKYFIAALIADDAEQAVILSMHRTPDRGCFGNKERTILGAVLPDIRSSMSMHLCRRNGRYADTLAAVLDQMTNPMAVLHEGGRLIFANPTMLTLLTTGDILKLRDCFVTGATPPVSRALEEAVQAALASDRSATALVRNDSDRPLLIQIAPLKFVSDRQFPPGADRLFCLFLDDPSRPHSLSVEAGMRLYGITRCEATVGGHLAVGMTVVEIARQLGVSRNTVRSHLAILRDKLGVHSALAVAAELRRAVSPFR
jgi:DNA-binding CsgD family transcriptional regulator